MTKMGMLDDDAELSRPHGWQNRRPHHRKALFKTARIAFYARERVYSCCCFDSAMVTIVVTVEVTTEEKLNFFKLAAASWFFFRSRCYCRSMATLFQIE